MFSTKTLTRTSFRGVNSILSTNKFVHQQLQVFSFTAAPSAFTLAPSDPTHNKNSPLSRSSQIARHFSSSSTDNSTTNTIANMASQFKVRKVGAPNTLEHRIYIEKDGVPISPFHDIPLYANEAQTILNMVVEIPRWTNGKLEVSLHMSSTILFEL
jgi:inorganic pyrophosphatase